MANIGPYPINDVVAMADRFGGITMATVRSSTWTDAFLAIKMREFYDDTLVRVANPAQSKDPAKAFYNTFVSGVGEDVTKIGEGVAEAVRSAAEAAVKVPAGLIKTLKFTPLIIAAAVGVAVIIFTAKAT